MRFLRNKLIPSRFEKKHITFIKWSFVSNMVMSTEQAISVHNMLDAVNCNSSSVRTTNYIGKDIIGQLGSITYILNMGRNVDKSPKRFITYSHILQQVSFASMCLTPVYPEYFLVIGGVSSMINNISFAGFGAVNAKCIRKLSTDDNIGEFYSIMSVVQTISSSVGLIFGILLTSFTPSNSSIAIIPVLAILRIFSFNKSIENLV